MYSEIDVLVHVNAWLAIEQAVLEIQHSHCMFTLYPESREMLEIFIRKMHQCTCADEENVL